MGPILLLFMCLRLSSSAAETLTTSYENNVTNISSELGNTILNANILFNTSYTYLNSDMDACESTRTTCGTAENGGIYCCGTKSEFASPHVCCTDSMSCCPSFSTCCAGSEYCCPTYKTCCGKYCCEFGDECGIDGCYRKGKTMYYVIPVGLICSFVIFLCKACSEGKGAEGVGNTGFNDQVRV